MQRSESNCSFYPACYWAGDCDYQQWRTADCGLPREEQERLRDAWRARITVKTKREELVEKYTRRIRNGEFDHEIT